MEKKKARIYARFSSQNQREESIEGQLRECNAYADRMGYIVTGEYADRAISGKEVDNRTAFRAMVRDAERGLFEVLLVYKMDRFARNRYDAAIYKYRLRRAGVQVVSARENIPQGAEGIILESMLDGFAEYYSVNLAENVRRGSKDTALEGKFNGGPVPYGYRIEEGRYVLDEARAPIVKEVFERIAAGERYGDIFASLNARGLRTLSGKPFSRGSITSMTRQEKYKGLFRYRVSDGDAVELDGAVPAIVSPELWDAVQARCEKAKHAPRTGKGAEKFVLTGKLFCGVCGTSFHGFSCWSRGKLYAYYRHNREHEVCKCPGAFMVRREELEGQLFDELAARVLKPELIDAIVARALELQAEDDTEATAALESELAGVDAALENIYKAIEAGILSAGLQARISELEARHDALVAEIDAGRKTTAARLSAQQIGDYLRGFLDGDIRDAGFREQLVDNFIERIVFEDGRAAVFLRYADDPEAVCFVLGDDACACLPKSKHVPGTFCLTFPLA